MSLVLKTLQLTGRSVTTVSNRTFINNEGLKKWAFSASGFNQYGLYRDDVLYEDDDVKVCVQGEGSLVFGVFTRLTLKKKHFDSKTDENMIKNSNFIKTGFPSVNILIVLILLHLL